MSRPASYHGTIEEINAAKEKRRQQIKEWGQKVLADADAALEGTNALLGVPTEPSDWDALELIPVVAVPYEEPTIEEEPASSTGESVDLVSETASSTGEIAVSASSTGESVVSEPKQPKQPKQPKANTKSTS
jgi:hypothetical protein